MFRKALASVAGFGVGYSIFARTWPEVPPAIILEEHNLHRKRVLDLIKNTKEYNTLINDPKYQLLDDDNNKIPEAHKVNQVTRGLFGGPKHLEVEPILFLNKEDGKLKSFAYLGPGLAGRDGKIHNGVISTLLDEGTCFCGFEKLPSKRGVTAKLSVDFYSKAQPGSTVVLSADVIQSKGRKVVIDGDITTIPINKGDVAEKIAHAHCILVEPKWFKYLNWVPLF